MADCRQCGGLLKPDVVFFGENVPRSRVDDCYALVERAGALVVLGSSLTVMSGYRFVRQAAKLRIPVVIINQGQTRGDAQAVATIDAPLGPALTALVRGLGAPGRDPSPGRGSHPLRSSHLKTVTSADGTAIAYEEQGKGPALILVDGALCARGAKEGLAVALAPNFTVFRYDRRGRGDSGDTLPYAVRAGDRGPRSGHRSRRRDGLPVRPLVGVRPGDRHGSARRGNHRAKIALYEAPYDDDPAARGPWTAYLDDLAVALAAGRRGDAVARFMAHVGMPAGQIAGMRQSPFFPALEAIAPTLAYDHAGLMGDSLAVPVGQAARVTVPALVMYGDASFPFMPATARTLSAPCRTPGFACWRARRTTWTRRFRPLCWRNSSPGDGRAPRRDSAPMAQRE